MFMKHKKANIMVQDHLNKWDKEGLKLTEKSDRIRLMFQKHSTLLPEVLKKTLKREYQRLRDKELNPLGSETPFGKKIWCPNYHLHIDEINAELEMDKFSSATLMRIKNRREYYRIMLANLSPRLFTTNYLNSAMVRIEPNDAHVGHKQSSIIDEIYKRNEKSSMPYLLECIVRFPTQVNDRFWDIHVYPKLIKAFNNMKNKYGLDTIAKLIEKYAKEFKVDDPEILSNLEADFEKNIKLFEETKENEGILRMGINFKLEGIREKIKLYTFIRDLKKLLPDSL